VVLDERLDQRTVMQHMLDAGVATRRGATCAHREPAYPRETWRATESLGTSERLQSHGLALPLFHDMTADDQDYVVNALHAACTALAG
jgi:dTDP-4-amino-4,6-dideoxygalactose transaminase